MSTLSNYERQALELLKMWDSRITEGSVPRYKIDDTPGAGLNVLATWTKNLISRMEERL